MIIPGLVQTILAETSVTDLLGTNTDGSKAVYAMQLEENSQLPAATMQIVANTSKPTLTTTGPQKTRVQVDCFGETYLQADTVRTALILFLNGRRGVALANGINIQGILLCQMLEFPYEWQSQIFRLGFEVYVFWNFPPAS